MMWTMARLLSGLMFCALGYYCGTLVTATFGEDRAATYFPLSIALIGLWQGWTVLGKRVGAGYGSSIGLGFRTSLQIALFGLAFYAIREMLQRAVALRYSDDFMGAIYDSMRIFIEYGGDFLAIPNAWMTLAIGGIVIGTIAEAAKRVWR